MLWDAQLRSVSGDVEVLKRKISARRAEEQAAAQAHASAGRTTFDAEAAAQYMEQRHQEHMEEEKKNSRDSGGHPRYE